MDSEVVLDLRFNKPKVNTVKYSQSEILHKIVTKLSSKKDLESSNSNTSTAMDLTQNHQPVRQNKLLNDPISHFEKNNQYTYICLRQPQPQPKIVEKFPNSARNPHFDVNFITKRYTNPPQNSVISTIETQNLEQSRNLSPSPEIQQRSPAIDNQISVITENCSQSCNSSTISSHITCQVEVAEVEKDQNLPQNIEENLPISNGFPTKDQTEPFVSFPITSNLESPAKADDKAVEIDEIPLLQCENEAGSETTEFDEAEEKTRKEIEQNSHNSGYNPVLKRGRGRPRLNPATKSTSMGKSVKKYVKKSSMAEFLKKKELMLWGKRENQGHPPQRFQFVAISKEKKRKTFKMSNGLGYIINSIGGLHRKRGRPRKIHDNGNGNCNGHQVNDSQSNISEVPLPIQNQENILQIENIEIESEESDCEGNDNDFNLGELLLNDKEFTDIDLMVGNEIFKAHKSVLASQSEYFSDLCKQVDRITFIPEVKPEVFIFILNFLYKGEVKLLDIGIENLIEIFNLAAKFKIKELLQVSTSQLNKFSGFSPEIGIRLLETASDFGDSEEILHTLLKSIIPIYKEIKKLDKWKEMVENPKFIKVIQRLVLILNS